MSAKLQTILQSIDSKLKESGINISDRAREIASKLISESKVIENDHGGAVEQKAEKLMRNAEEQRKMSEASTNEAEQSFRAIAKLTNDDKARQLINSSILPKVEEERSKWKTSNSSTFINAYDSLRKFYDSLKKENASVKDLQLGLTHLVYYLLNTTQGIVPNGQAVSPQSVYESSIVRAIKNDIYKGHGYLKSLNRDQLIAELQKSYDVITSDKTDAFTRNEYIINIDSIIKAINDLSSDSNSRFGGAPNSGYSLIPETTDFVFDPTKVRLGILSIYSKLNTLYDISKKINEGSTMTEQQEARFVRAVARIEDYVSYSNVKRDMLFRISPVESVLYSRIMAEINSLRDISDPDVVKFLRITEQAISPLLANNAVSSHHINDFYIDIGVDSIELDTRVFKLIREIAYKRRLAGFVDISQNVVEIKENLASQARQFTDSEKIAIARSAPTGNVPWTDDITKTITQLSGASIQLDYMTQLMNYEATSEPSNADTVYNAIFRSKNRVHDNLTYVQNPIADIQNATINGKISTDAVRDILPEIENMINIFARVSKSKEFSGPKEIADAMYKFIALQDTINFAAPVNAVYKKVDGETFDVRLGNILRLFAYYNSRNTSIGDVINPNGIYARFADFNDQHNAFGGSIEEEKEKYGDSIDPNRLRADFSILSREALLYFNDANNVQEVTDVDQNFGAIQGLAAANTGNYAPEFNLQSGNNDFGHYLITLPVIISSLISGNVLLAPFFSRLLFGPNTFVENFCSSVVAYCTDNSLIFVPRSEGSPSIYDFRASEITFKKRQVPAGQDGIHDIVSIGIARDPKDSVHRDNVRRDTESLINGFIFNKQLSFVDENDFYENRNLIFLLLQHFEVSTDINARRRGERANLENMLYAVKQSRVRNNTASFISDEEIVTLYYNLSLEAARITVNDNDELVYKDEGVSFPFSIARVNDCPRILAIALEKITSKYGRGSESLTQFDVHILGSRREADFISQNALQTLEDIDDLVAHEVQDISLARALISFAKTFALDVDNANDKDIINNTLNLLHSGDRVSRFNAVQTRHNGLPGNAPAGAQLANPQVPFPDAPFVKDIFVLWNQYNLLNNIYLTLGGSTGTSMDMLISDMNIEIKKANVPVIHGDEKETIANNIFARYISMLKLIVGRIFSVVDKNLIESNVGKSSSLERYKLGVADLFGGADFNYNRENKDKYIKFVLLAEWYFTFFKSKDMFDIKPFIIKESGPFRGLNEAVFAKIYDNVAYSNVALGKIVSSVNVNSDIQQYIESINRSIGFYIFNSVDKAHNPTSANISLSLDDSITSANIFNGIPTKLPLANTFDVDLAANRNNAVKSRYDLMLSSSSNNIGEMYSRNERLVKLLADINSGFEDVDLSQHDEFALANIVETFDKKVQGKTVDQEAIEFLEFLNTIDTFEFSNKQNVVSNFINIPIKLADDLALLFEDDYNELVVKSNYGKLKNIIVGNDTLFKIESKGKDLRFTTHIPTMITTLLDIASGSIIKYSGYVDYSKLGDIEKQISFVKRKRDMIATRLNSKEFSTNMIETMLPQVIMELYKDHTSVYTQELDKDGNPLPEPDWVSKQKEVLKRSENYRGRGAPRTNFDNNLSRKITALLHSLKEVSDIVSLAVQTRGNLVTKPEVTEFEKEVARAVAIGEFLNRVSLAMEYGLNSADDIVDRYARVVKGINAFFSSIRNNMLCLSKYVVSISSKVRSRNRADLLVEIASLRAKAAANATSTDYIFFDFYTDNQIADKLLLSTNTNSLVPVNKGKLSIKLEEIRGDLGVVDASLGGFLADIRNNRRNVNNKITNNNNAYVALDFADDAELDQLREDVTAAEVAYDRAVLEYRRIQSSYLRLNNPTQVQTNELNNASAAVDNTENALEDAKAELDLALENNGVVGDAAAKNRKETAKLENAFDLERDASLYLQNFSNVLNQKPQPNDPYNLWTAWRTAVSLVNAAPALQKPAASPMTQGFQADETENFQVDQNPDTPIDSGYNITLRRALNGSHGPHREFYQIYHMMFLIYSSTSDSKLKNLMRALLHQVDVQETFSSFSKSILDQLDFGGSYEDFVRTKKYRSVAALGDFSSVIDFKGTDFNKVRLCSYLGTAIFRDMMALMSVNQTGFSSSKTADENVKDIIHKASALALMVRNAMGVLGLQNNGIFNLSKVALIQPNEIGSQANYKDYSDVNVDLLSSGVFGSKTLNCRDICSAINFVESQVGNKSKAESMRAKCPEKVCQTSCLVPGATVVWDGVDQVDFNAWLRKGLPTSLYTHNKDMLASISDRMDKLLVFLQAKLANVYRVFGKGSRLQAIPTKVPTEYSNLISYASSVAGSNSVNANGLSVVDTQDHILSRVAEALYAKARVIDIPVFTHFKNEYSPADLLMIMKSDFMVCAPESVTCKVTSAALKAIQGQVQQRAISEILLTPGDSTNSVVTLPSINGVDHAAYVSKHISPAAVSAINEVSTNVEYPFIAFSETSSAETLVATALARKLRLVLDCKFPCSIKEYVCILNDIGSLLVSTKTSNPNIWAFLMSRIKSLTCEARSNPAKDLVNKYVVVLGNAIECLEYSKQSKFGGDYAALKHQFGGDNYAALKHQFGGDYAEYKHQFGGDNYAAYKHQFGGDNYAALKHQFGGDNYAALKHQFGGDNYAALKHQFGGAQFGRPPVTYASQLPPDQEADLPESAYDYLSGLHRNYISGAKVTDLSKNTKDLELYVTRQDAANNLPALHNVLTNLNRVVSAIVQLSNEWLSRPGQKSTAYSRDVEEYRKVCISIKSFTGDSINAIAKELNSDLGIGEALKSLVRNVNQHDTGIKHIYDIIMSDVHAILPRVAIKGSPFAFMSPVFNALFYSRITGNNDVLPPIREMDSSAPFIFACISNIANVRLAKNLSFGKRYEKLPYSNTLSADDRAVSRNVLYLNNIVDININPIKLSYMKQSPLFYSTEVFSRVFDRSVREYVNDLYGSFTATEKSSNYKFIDPNGNAAGVDKQLSDSYRELIDFLINPLEFYKLNSAGAALVVLPEEFKNGVTRGRNFQGQAQIYGHSVNAINNANIGTNVLYFWTKEVYKFMRNFLVDRISHAGDASELGINRGLNVLIRNEHIFK